MPEVEWTDDLPGKIRNHWFDEYKPLLLERPGQWAKIREMGHIGVKQMTARHPGFEFAGRGGWLYARAV